MKTVFAWIFFILLAVPLQAQHTGWIGVSVEDGKDRGAVVRSVEDNSPAGKAGVKAGDVIVEYNAMPVLGSLQFSRLVRETPAGRSVDLKVQRDNREQALKMTIGEPPSRSGNRVILGSDMRILRDRLNNLGMDMPRMRVFTSFARSGVQVDEMTPQLREFFGVSGNNGVLVSSVDANSAAEKAGLKAGDVIVAVNNNPLGSPAEFDRQIRQAGEKATLRVVRNKAEREITVERKPDSR